MLASSAHRRCVAAIVPIAMLLAVRLAAQEAGQNGQALLGSAGCAGCHSAEGRGTAAAPPIVGRAISLEEFRAPVRMGRGSMPAYPAAALPETALEAMYVHASRQDGIAMPTGRVGVGARLYEQSGCYSCHSNQGQGGTQGPRIGPEPVRWGKFVWYIRYPTAQMPPYSPNLLSDQALADIYAFLEVRPRPRAVGDIPLLAP